MLVFPMCVGMNRLYRHEYYNKDCVPHVCGDEPALSLNRGRDYECSPCVWG